MKLHPVMVEIIKEHYQGRVVKGEGQIFNRLIEKGLSENEAHMIVWEFTTIEQLALEEFIIRDEIRGYQKK